MRTIDCPECANSLPIGKKAVIHCEKCGASFKPRIKVYVKPHEYRNAKLYAIAHLQAAIDLLRSEP